MPDYSTVSRRQKTLQVTIGAVPPTTGLHLLVDSTDIKMLGEGEWKTKKHGAEYRRQWRKVPLGIDASTLEIRAMEVTDDSIGDAPVLPALLNQIPVDEKIATVSGDGAYDTKDCHEAIALRVAYAIVPTRKNANPGRRTAAVPMRVTIYCTRRVGWAVRSGRNGAAIISEALSKPRCAASNCWANASWRVTTTVRSPNYKCGLRC